MRMGSVQRPLQTPHIALPIRGGCLVSTDIGVP